MKLFQKNSTAYRSDPDVQLMLAFKQGDDDAFERLMRKHYRSVLNFIARFIGRPAAAEDLAQEVFLRIYRSRSRYAPKARFRTWMFTIARNISLNEIRRSGKSEDLIRQGDPDDWSSTSSSPQSGDAPGPEAELLLLERREKVHRAIATLPDNQRSAVLLRRFEDLSYAEIASVLGVSQKAVKSLLSRAKVNLRQRLAEFIEK
jgi:RNA polymerase sigma-70 factor (ECF subfamily)